MDGASQTDFSGDSNPYGPEIVLNGSSRMVTRGLHIQAGYCIVKDLAINGFVVAVQIWKPTAHDNQVRGCYIGLDATGLNAVGVAGDSQQDGIGIYDGAARNLVGGPTPAERNVISGNGTGVSMYEAGPDNQIKGNYIGTNSLGTAAVPNGAGVFSSGYTPTLVVGGTTAAERNVISGNSYGVMLYILLYTLEARVQGNFIGVHVSGTKPLGNLYAGVEIGTDHNLICGVAPGAGNVIAYNGWDGVFLPNNRDAAFSSGNSILHNSIYGNTGLGININYSVGVVTPNDAGDGDLGPNGSQNFPVISSAIVKDGKTFVNGTLNSTPNSRFDVEFFGNTRSHDSEYGEGETFLSSLPVSTDASGNANFSLALPAQDGFITATATDVITGNTSEFSRAVAVIFPPAITGFTPGRGLVGARVALSGTALSGATEVLFQGVAARFSVESDTSIIATVPPGAKSGPLTVATPGGRAISTGSFKVEVPSLSIADFRAFEGNKGTTFAYFTAKLSVASTQTVSVRYDTADKSALSGSDYVPMSGTLNFAPGITSKTCRVAVNSDPLAEADEAFYVNLSRVTNAIISDGQATGTIVNDDEKTAPTIAITSPSSGSIASP